MTMTIYRSTDASAPTLTSANGSLINVLDKCLVTGYGSKAGAGWTKPFTGTNLAAFKQGVGGNNRFIRVYDSGVSSANPNLRRALVRGYENMTAISTGTGPFPTTTQINSQGQLFGYMALNTPQTPITWNIYASSNYFIVHVEPYDDTGSAGTTIHNNIFGFGHFNSLKSGDIYNEVIFAGSNDASSADFAGSINGGGITSQVFVTRNDLGTLGAVEAPLFGAFGTAYIGQGSLATYPYPDRINNSLKMGRVSMWTSGYKRGYLPGIWDVAHVGGAIGPNKTTWSGHASGELAGRSFTYVSNICPYAYATAWPAIETSDTWD